MEKQISIIIPTCNMERYISQCLESLLIPNLSDVEILVINDGSKDRSSDIAHDYERRFPESIRVIDKTNGHYGSCINRGLKEATGRYIKVLDADDSFNKNEFNMFVEFLRGVSTEIVFSDYCIVDEYGTITSKKCFPKRLYNKVMTFGNALPLFLHENMAMHAVAYRTDFLKSIQYSQTEGVAYTDQEWIFAPVLNVNTAAYFPHIVYRYLVGRQGQSVDSSVITKAMTLQMAHFSKRLDDFEEMLPKLSQEHRQYAFARMRYSMVNTFKCILFGKTTSHFSHQLLENDIKLNRVFPELYESLQAERLKPRIPFHYIKYWRNRYPKGKPMPIISIIKAFSKLDY